ncbi:MAG: sugar-binding domain-containing protein, partial [Verrucomicrobiota bacterium]
MLLIENLDTDWLFRRDEEGRFREGVSLPHSPFVSDLDGNEHWFGTCEYIRSMKVDSQFLGMQIVLRLGGAMQRTTVYLDGEWVGEHKGGFLPFEIDLSRYTIIGETHELRVEISNRWDPDIPPGKRFEELDFCWYGGLYRDAALVAYPESRIESNLRGGECEQGGVLVQTLALEASKALLKVTVLAKLKIGEKSSDLGLRVSVGRSGRESPQFEGFYPRSDWREGPGGGFEFEFEIENPRLWSVSRPHLYDCRVDLVRVGNSQVDSVRTRFGIRRIGFSRSEGFTLNGERLQLRGVNRHQEYPYVGYAVPPAAQYRDAVRIKEAGFDYVRLSHYPQCSSFLDAC